MPVLCPACGNLTSEEGPICVHCGERRLAPEQRAKRDTSVSCPNCKNPSELVFFGPEEIDCCTRCGGLWFDAGELEALRAYSKEKGGDDLLEALRYLPKPAASVPSEPFYLKCPVCAVLMQRENHLEESGVIVQRCRAHGAFLKRSSIAKIIALAANGGEQHLEARAQESRSKKANRRLEELEQRVASQAKEIEETRRLALLWSWLF